MGGRRRCECCDFDYGYYFVYEQCTYYVCLWRYHNLLFVVCLGTVSSSFTLCQWCFRMEEVPYVLERRLAITSLVYYMEIREEMKTHWRRRVTTGHAQ